MELSIPDTEGGQIISSVFLYWLLLGGRALYSFKTARNN